MIGLKEQNSASPIAPQNTPMASRRQPHLYPFSFSMGPVAFCITSVLLIALMAVFYLSQVNQAVAANQQLQDINAQQITLNRQDQDLVAIIGDEQSPAYITANAQKLGLTLVNQETVRVLVVKHLLPSMDNKQLYQP